MGENPYENCAVITTEDDDVSNNQSCVTLPPPDWDLGISKLVTGIRKNMKARMMSLWDRLMLRKRYIIETIFDQLKNISQIEHTRHRSPVAFVVHLIAGLVAYTFQPKKPSIKITRLEEQALMQI